MFRRFLGALYVHVASEEVWARYSLVLVPPSTITQGMVRDEIFFP